MSSNDNRAVSMANPAGALVRLLIPLGEPNSLSAVGNPLLLFTPSGFPSCTADLQATRVSCGGLVPGAPYTLTRRRGKLAVRATADRSGGLHPRAFRGGRALAGGDVVRLSNGAERTLTKLHVAHLRVDISAQATVIASGRCQPGDYYGRPLTTPPVTATVDGNGVAGSGTICPVSGNAAGLSSRAIGQTDDLSGGQTVTRVPDIENTSPTQGETVYGPFIALANAGVPAPHATVASSSARIALTVVRSRHGGVVFHAYNVNTATGARVSGLAPGAYRATWVLTDNNGDTRTIRTRFQASQVLS